MLVSNSPNVSTCVLVSCEIPNAPNNKVFLTGRHFQGVPTAAVIALKNPFLRVTVIDRDEFRIRRWNSAHLPISEPELDNIVRLTRDGSKACSVEAIKSSLAQRIGARSSKISIPAREPNLTFTTASSKSIAEADMIFICVNTPTKTTGVGAGYATDMTAVESVVKEVAVNAKAGAILVEKSTVPCRTAKLVQDIVRYALTSSSHFLRTGLVAGDLLPAY